MSSYDAEEYYALLHSTETTLSKLRDEADEKINDVQDDAEDRIMNIQAKADRKIAAIEAHVRREEVRLGRKLNVASRTCQLPAEILAAIFEHVSRFSLPDPMEYWSNTRKEQIAGDIYWYKCVHHCCSYWSKLALATPNLWTTIVLVGTNGSLKRTNFHLMVQRPLRK
ncbi:hypothetical protein DL96DRAFT_601461 [Flagelloscypha sp. PMI_526]|nr:hypothetical protein DL96DRAFT_601461 [Flagelloscypha sp. PMI_526]